MALAALALVVFDGYDSYPSFPRTKVMFQRQNVPFKINVKIYFDNRNESIRFYISLRLSKSELDKFIGSLKSLSIGSLRHPTQLRDELFSFSDDAKNIF